MISAALRILKTTDLHMQILGAQGLVNLAHAIKALRADGTPTLLLDNGDWMQGSPLADVVMAETALSPHPMVAAMNALRYDAVGLGNHEFDYGLAALEQVIQHSQSPIICANVRRNPASLFTAPWALIERDLTCDDGVVRKIKIGVIGFVPPQIVDWARHQLEGEITTDDIIAAALTHTPALRRAGADIVVALAHSGIGPTEHSDRMENAAIPLAALRAIDVVLTGHTHDQFPGPHFEQSAALDPEKGTIHGKPALMAGACASHLGVLDLNLQYQDGDWRIARHKASLVTADTPDPDLLDTMKAELAAPMALTKTRMQEPLVQTNTRLTSHFTMVGIDPLLDVLADLQSDLARAALADTLYRDIPLLSAISSFKAGGRRGSGNFLDIQPGPLSRGDLAEVSPFNNTMAIVLRHGWQLRMWLEHGAGFFQQFDTVTPVQSLINETYPAYNFDRIIGLDYTYDLTQYARFSPGGSLLNVGARRVCDITYQGRPVEDDDVFMVATNSYRARGGGGVTPASESDIVYTGTESLVTQMATALKDGPPISAQPRRHFAFRSVPGVAAQFLTHQNADVSELPLNVKATGEVTDGFAAYHLAL